MKVVKLGEKEEGKWMRAVSMRTVILSNGLEFDITITNWHWISFDWLTENLETDADKIYRASQKLGKNRNLNHDFAEYIDGCIDAVVDQ